MVGVTDDLSSSLSAVDLVKAGVAGAGRQGRRRPARHGPGGGPDGAKAPEALKAIEAALAVPAMMKFTGTENYVATDDLMLAVNAAVTLSGRCSSRASRAPARRMLAEEIAEALEHAADRSGTSSRPPRRSRACTSTTRSAGCATRQLGDERVQDIRNYIVKGVLWQAFSADEPPVLLIDEIDKADIEFPNDLLRELDRMEFYVYETRELVKARHRPIVFITSQQREGAARRVPAPLLLPLHPLPRRARRWRASSTCTSRS